MNEVFATGHRVSATKQLHNSSRQLLELVRRNLSNCGSTRPRSLLPISHVYTRDEQQCVKKTTTSTRVSHPQNRQELVTLTRDSCQHLAYQGIHTCDRYKAVQVLCVALTTTARITSLATPVSHEPLKRVMFEAYDTTSSSTTTCSNPNHLPINPHPRSLYRDLPDDFDIPPLPSSNARYEKPRMTKRTLTVNFDCKECRLERARPGCDGMTIKEEMLVKHPLERAARRQIWESWNEGFDVWWNDPVTVRERKERGGASTFAESLLFEGGAETALQGRAELEERDTGEDGRCG
ncbi:hypothetical protein MMC27_007715 [Xylographa pallens]|nr:hypothetical protein [Xylographa pallens]